MIHDAFRLTALRFAVLRSGLLPLCLTVTCCFWGAGEVAQAADDAVVSPSVHRPIVRSRKPDRGTYRPPIVGQTESQKARPNDHRSQAARSSASPASHGLPEPIVLGEMETVRPINAVTEASGAIRQVGYDAPAVGNAHTQPAHIPGTETSRPIASPSDVADCSCSECLAGRAHPYAVNHDGPQSDSGRLSRFEGPRQSQPATLLERASHVVYGSPMAYESMQYDSMASSSCDEGCCDDGGCDSMGCGRSGKSCIGRNWFGSLELLLMFRKGDRLPPLVTTGALGDVGTQILYGNETYLKDITAGGRLTIGSWLDSCKDRSFVGRFWFAGEQNDSFSSSQSQNPEMSRPFFNVTDGQTPAQDTQVITSAGRAAGVVDVRLESQLYGADFSIRQLWHKQYGGTVDLLYGYQYLRADESLGIATRSTSLDDDFAPIGAVLQVSDLFDVENEFHGAQIGIASNYREGCWSFSSLWKLGFGNIRRRANLIGNTTSSIDGDVFTDPNGLLVRSTNDGVHADSTFGWVPELDLTLGWQQFPAFDVTCGYHLIAMTDALQVSGTIDPALASNLAAPPLGAQRPSGNFRYGTIYVQGIHFGLSYIY